MNQSSIRRIPVVAAFALLIALIVPLAFAGAKGPTGKDLAPPLPPSLQDVKSGSEPPKGKEDTRIPGHYIVIFEDSVEQPGNLAEVQVEQKDGELGFIYRYGIKGYSAELSRADVEALREDPRVKYVAPDRKIELHAQSIPAGIKRVGATENVTADIDGVNDAPVNVDVAVIDTGIDNAHPDLNVFKRINCVPPGEGFISEKEGNTKEFEEEKCIEGSGTDGYGHGTHVAGTIGAIDNAEGVVGVAPGARLWALKVGAKDGLITASWLTAAITWVTSKASEIEVANMSLGGEGESPSVESAINASVAAGVVYVVSAGNSAADVKYFSPAKNPNVITVSAMADYDGKPASEVQPLRVSPLGFKMEKECEATDDYLNVGDDDTLAMFSNYGEGVEVAAPGVCVNSTVPGGGYDQNWGTSMAAPHVAGAAALLASKSNPNSKAAVEAIRGQIVDSSSQYWSDLWSWRGEEQPPAQYFSPKKEWVWETGEPQEPTLHVAPVVARTYTIKAIHVKQAQATLTGGANPFGSETTYQLEYGVTTGYGKSIPVSSKSLGAGSKDLRISETLTGLEPNTLYHYRLKTTNTKTQAITNGPDRTFKTKVAVTTAPATNLTPHKARLNGVVNPVGLATSYWFEWGTTTGYGNKVPASPISIGAGVEDVDVTQAISSLKSNTEYHYRVAIENANGVRYGADQTFRTTTAGFLSEKYPALVLGEGIGQIYITTHWFDPFQQAATPCTLIATKSSLASAGETLAAAVTGGKCWEYQFERKLSMNGCEFIFHPGHMRPIEEEEGWKSPATFDGWMDIGGTKCTEIFIDGIGCDTYIPPQTGLETVSEEAKEGDFYIEFDAEGLRYKQSGGCFNGSFSDGELDGLILFKGYDDLGGIQGSARDLTISNSYHATPTVTTGSAIAVDRTKATVQGSLNPNLLSTTYQFEYGTTTSYGMTAPIPAKSAGSGQQSVSVNQALEGLIPGQLYHYRLAATNSEGTSYGKDQTFTTTLPQTPKLEAETYKATISGSHVTQHKLTVSKGVPLNCAKAQFSGFVSTASSSLLLTPAMSSCTGFGTNATWTMNSCAYKHNILNSGPPYAATMDISCSKAGDEIVIWTGICTVKIPAQTGLKGIALANAGSGSERSVTVTYSITGITFTEEGVVCPEKGLHTNGSYTGSTKLTALDSGGKADGLFLSGEGTQGLFMAGKESGEEANKPKLGAEKYPVSITGPQVTQHKLTVSKGAPLQCSKAQFSASASAATSSLSLMPAMSSCTGFGTAATWNMNSCSYKHNILNSGPPYAATMDISCSKAGDEIVIWTGICTVKIPAQTGLKGIALANAGSGSERSVTVTYSITGITFKEEGLVCPEKGTHANGAYTGSTSLLGFS
jgi:subtilisin family serine protease